MQLYQSIHRKIITYYNSTTQFMQLRMRGLFPGQTRIKLQAIIARIALKNCNYTLIYEKD